jgi:3-phosphoshikimate 1-carboxyvinyltransferase
LRALGVGMSGDAAARSDIGDILIMGRGPGGLGSAPGPLDAGNSGTTMRLMAGVLAAQPFTTRMVGDASLSRRPMRRVIDPLERMGCRIDAADGRPPLTIHGAALHGITHRSEVPSAQVKSAILLAGIHASGTTTVVEPALTRDHTEHALRAFGGSVQLDEGGKRVSVAGGQSFTAQRLVVPGDFSSAAFWMVAAAAQPGSRVEIEDVGLNPSRTSLIDVLRRFGALVHVERTSVGGGEPRGTITVEGDRVGRLDIAAEEVPGLIDELPAIAALAGHGAEVSVRGAAELRVKETDRIAALVAGLRGLGIAADERPDGFVAGETGRSTAGDGEADARGDHRMAMAFAIAALAGRSPSRIIGADSVVISYPGFFETLGRLVA